MTKQQETMDYDTEFVTVDETEIHYTSWGDPESPPVVCVHDITRNASDFETIARSLSEQYYVVCPDMPGHGLSEWQDTPSQEVYSLMKLADLCERFCDKLELNEIRWIGTSLGGMLGIILAGGPLRDRITHLIVHNACPGNVDAISETLRDKIAYMANPPRVENLTELKEYYRKLWTPSVENMTEEELNRFTVNSAQRLGDGGTMPSYDPECIEPLLLSDVPADDYYEFWENITANLLIIRSSDSIFLSLESYQQMLSLQPEAEKVDFDQPHFPLIDSSSETRTIREFLTERKESNGSSDLPLYTNDPKFGPIADL